MQHVGVVGVGDMGIGLTDGISQEPRTGCRALAEHGIEYAELQFVLGKEVGEHTKDEVAQPLVVAGARCRASFADGVR
jgi:hypothetical protein